MKNLIALIILILPLGLLAQTAERWVIGSAGGSGTAGNIQYSNTTGEVVVATATSATLILTQGFQQPEGGTVGIQDVAAGLSLRAYPNPAVQSVTLDFTVEQPLMLTMAVFDISGKNVTAVKQLNVTGSLKEQVSLEGLSAGQYLINLSTADGKLNKSIKVQKVN